MKKNGRVTNFCNAWFGKALLIIILAGFTWACQKDAPADDPKTTALKKVVYVADEDDGTITVINAESKAKIKIIDLSYNGEMYMPHNVQVAPNGKTVWVTCVPMQEGSDEFVAVIDAVQNTVIKHINVGKEQHIAHVVLDDESKFAYVTGNESNQVIKLDADSLKEVRRFEIGDNHKPHGMRYYNHQLFIANMDGKSMSILDINTGQINEIQLGGVAVQTAITPNGAYAFASLYDTREVAVYNIQTQNLTKVKLPEGSQGPIQLYPTPDNKMVYVCDQGVLENRSASNKVYVLDIEMGMIDKTITVGNGAHGIVICNQGTQAYVTNSKDNTISIIDLQTNSVTQTLPVGKAPNGISFWFSSNGNIGGMK